MTTKLEEKTKVEPIVASAWKALTFLKDGRSTLSERTWPSENEAVEAIQSTADNVREWLKREARTKVMSPDSNKFKFYADEYHYSIPVPINP